MYIIHICVYIIYIFNNRTMSNYNYLLKQNPGYTIGKYINTLTLFLKNVYFIYILFVTYDVLFGTYIAYI